MNINKVSIHPLNSNLNKVQYKKHNIIKNDEVSFTSSRTNVACSKLTQYRNAISKLSSFSFNIRDLRQLTCEQNQDYLCASRMLDEAKRYASYAQAQSLKEESSSVPPFFFPIVIQQGKEKDSFEIIEKNPKRPSEFRKRIFVSNSNDNSKREITVHDYENKRLLKAVANKPVVYCEGCTYFGDPYLESDKAQFERMRKFNPDGSTKEYTVKSKTYYYDKDGRAKAINETERCFEVNNDLSLDYHIQNTRSKYYNNGERGEKPYQKRINTIKTTINADGKVVSYEELSKMLNLMGFDEKGNCIYDSSQEVRNEYTFDKNGNPVKYTSSDGQTYDFKALPFRLKILFEDIKNIFA